MRVSIHSLPQREGRPEGSDETPPSDEVSIHSLPQREGRRTSSATVSAAATFRSTPSHKGKGDETYEGRNKEIGIVSIHSLPQREGRREFEMNDLDVNLVSIHSLPQREGRRGSDRTPPSFGGVSIHSLPQREGRRGSMFKGGGCFWFRSTPSHKGKGDSARQTR